MTGRRLGLTCIPVDRETPTSFTARLAARNMVVRAGDFCLDMRLDWRAIIMGNAEEIGRLADLAGVSASSLQRYAPRSKGPARHKIGRELATNRTIRRMGSECCPICLTDSVNRLGFAGAFRRLDWQLVSVRCCEIHHVPLISLRDERLASHAYDFASVVKKNWGLLQHAAETLSSRKPTGLEDYIRQRLAGHVGDRWVDELALPVVSKASEMLGMRMIFGAKAKSTSRTEADWHVCGQQGYSVLKGGPSALIDVLQDLKAEFRSPISSHNRDIGAFFHWLGRDLSAREPEPIRRIVRQFVWDNYPVISGMPVLGRANHQPHCVTLGSVEKNLGIRQERLIAMLSSITGTSRKKQQRGHLTRQEVEDLRVRIGDIVPIHAAGSVAGCSYHNVTELIKAGLLSKRSNGASTLSLSRSQIDALIRPVRGLPEGIPNPKLMPIEDVRQLTARRLVLIYKHFLDDKLPSARRDPAKHGINALLLDPEETTRVLTGPNEHHGFRIERMLRHLGINHVAYQWLVRDGHLRTRRVKTDSMKAPRTYISDNEIEAFKQAFVTMPELGERLGATNRGELFRMLEKLTLQPLYSRGGASKIYHRRDVEAALKRHA
jgi:hypothetical protein